MYPIPAPAYFMPYLPWASIDPQTVTPTSSGANIQLELPPVWPQKVAFIRHVQEQVAQQLGPCVCYWQPAATCALPTLHMAVSLLVFRRL